MEQLLLIGIAYLWTKVLGTAADMFIAYYLERITKLLKKYWMVAYNKLQNDLCLLFSNLKMSYVVTILCFPMLMNWYFSCNPLPSTSENKNNILAGDATLQVPDQPLISAENKDWMVNDTIILSRILKEFFPYGCKSEQRYCVLKVPAGRIKRVELPDNSIVTLNAQSSLRFPCNLGYKNQVLELEGEALFAIKGANAGGLKIHAGWSDILVLGTTFTVNSYSDNDYCQIAVIVGKVKVTHHKYGICLNAGERTKVGHKDDQLLKEPFDPATQLAWVYEELILDGKTIREVCREAAKWYGVDINIVNGKVARMCVTGKFDKNGSITGLFENIKFVDSKIIYKQDNFGGWIIDSCEK